ncbi:NADP oxidoreductase [Nocardioides sp. Root122]|uniref:NADPH-dependent F420 reductase n=1 Tax=Nocardioides TaxID=1839 RepID=UPI0007037809|nr:MULTISPECIES: NAD(P)-binding domain-containing protein [Nocardioides]KQV64195.1 NADP oxidoreductase [Nocardioides sp. Root122]MCK9825183.1 NAD(P)-binding domain-containing protein [Nocardioides cavernae]
MDIAVLGTGMVGQALAGGLTRIGHAVVVGTRDPDATLARTDPDGMGNPPFATWHAEHTDVALATYADAAAGADLVVLAGNGAAALDMLAAAGADHLAGKVLIDISNPLDFSAGFPPSLFVKDTDSLGERIQAAFPETKVVKSLNTLTASLMVDPAQLPEGTTVFVSGDDARAKATVSDILTALGHTDVIDLGGIESARGTEMLLPLWLRTMGALGTGMFNIKVVR